MVGGGTSELERHPWVLAAGVPVPQAVAVAPPSATFEKGTVAGSTGCNRYTASYTVEGDAVSFGNVASTLKACPPPADAVERAYVAALGRVARWRVEDGQLVLADAGGADVLRFARAGLEGTWVATEILRGGALTSPLGGTELSARFGVDGSLAGAAGCNTYRASYSKNRRTIAIAAPAPTRKFCAQPDGVMEQEAAFLALLTRATSYRLDASTLELLDADEMRLVVFARKNVG